MVKVIEFIQGPIRIGFVLLILLISYVPSIIIYKLIMEKSTYFNKTGSEAGLIHAIIIITSFLLVALVLPGIICGVILISVDPTGVLMNSIMPTD